MFYAGFFVFLAGKFPTLGKLCFANQWHANRIDGCKPLA